MGKTYDRLDAKLIDFIKAQKMFFVATAPRSTAACPAFLATPAEARVRCQTIA